MNFVFVCQQNPWRLNNGALIRNYWMVRALAREHRVHLVTADDRDEAVPDDFARTCASISRFPRALGTAGRVRRALSALRPNGSYFTSGAVTRPLQRAVAELANRPNSAVMIDLSLRDALKHTRAPFIFNAHNTEHELLRRRAAFEREPVRTLVRFEAGRTRRVEADFLRRALLVAACSADDAEELAQLEPSAREKIFVVPNGVDVSRYAAVAAGVPDSATILVSGSYDWQPNIVGLNWFVDAVLPRLRERLPGTLDVRVAGRMSDALAARLDALDGVTAVPRPTDMRDELERARIVLAPILASSGTRLRILEAWAAGRPVATTPSGALGLRFENGGDILVADGARELADAAVRLIAERELWAAVRANALKRAIEYDWQTIGERFVRQAGPVLRATASG